MTYPTPEVADTEPDTDRLEVLRAELDRIDLRLLEAVRARLECAIAIARYKREHGLPMMQPHRIEVVQRRAAAYAARHGMDSTFLHRLYEVIVAEMCRVEDEVIEAGELR